MAKTLQTAAVFVAGIVVGAGVALSPGGAFAEPDSPDTGSTSTADAENTAWNDLEGSVKKADADLTSRITDRIGQLEGRRAAIERLDADRTAVMEAMRRDEEAALTAIAEHQATAASGTVSKDRADMNSALADEAAALEDLRLSAAGDPAMGTAVGALLQQHADLQARIDSETKEFDATLQQAAAAEARGEATDQAVKEMTDMMAEIRHELQRIEQARTDQMTAFTKVW
jgi:chromosome segregation ATPase